MAATKTIALEKPVELHGKSITEIVLREPTGGHFLDYGDPYITSKTTDNGAIFYVEDKSVVARYLDVCVVHDNGRDVLRLLTLRDARAVKENLLSFFAGAAAPATEEASSAT